MRDAVIGDEIHVMGVPYPSRLKRQRRFCGRFDLIDDLVWVAYQYGHIYFVIQQVAVGAFVDDDVCPRRKSFSSEPAREDDRPYRIATTSGCPGNASVRNDIGRCTSTTSPLCHTRLTAMYSRAGEMSRGGVR